MIRTALVFLAIACQLRAITFGIDSIGVVQSVNPPTSTLETVLGWPTIGYGLNPWNYEDVQERKAVDLQVANNAYQSSPFHINGVGTVAYSLYDGAQFGGPPATSLTSAITTVSQTTIAIADASRLNLTGLTSVCGSAAVAILVDTEMIRICATTASSGAATLTVPYNGRGIAAANTYRSNSLISPAATHLNGAVVYQYAVIGTSTLYHSDTSWGASGPLAPASIPGPIGPIMYTTGLATVGLGSSGMTAFGGANWSGETAQGFSAQGSISVTLSGVSGTITVNQPVNGLGITPGTTVAAISGTTLTLSAPTLYGLSNTQLSFGVQAGDMIKLTNSTHASGTAFPFWCQIISNSSGSLMCNRPFPSDGDAGSYTYQIVAPRYVSLEFADPGSYPHTGGTFRTMVDIEYVESETQMYGIAQTDYTQFLVTGSVAQSCSSQCVHYTYKDVLAAQTQFGPNFYATPGVNHWVATQGSYAPAKALSDNIDNWYAGDPETNSGWNDPVPPLFWGAGVIQAIQKKILDSGDPVNWGDLRGWGKQSVFGFFGISSSCITADVRDHAYSVAPLALLALYDPDPSWQAYWQTQAATELTRSQTCIRTPGAGYTVANGFPPSAAYSFANTSNLFLGGASLTFGGGCGTTNLGCGTSLNSTYPTGLSDLCGGKWIGTVTVANGASTAAIASTTLGTIGTGGNTNTRLWITDGASYTLATQYSVSGSLITLSGVYSGQSGTFTAMAETIIPGPPNLHGGANGMTVIGNSNTDSLADNLQLQKNYACYVLNSTTVQFDRLTGLSGSGFHIDAYNVTGFYTQPFFNGIQSRVLGWFSAIPGSTGTGFAALLPFTGQWMINYGFDTHTLGTYYGAVDSICGPQVIPSTIGNNVFYSIQGFDAFQDFICGNDQVSPALYNGENVERVATAEAMDSYLRWWVANKSIPNMLIMDRVYSLFGNCVGATGGVYCDSAFVNTSNEMSTGFIGGYKWSGFFFGPVSGPRAWPALRAQFLATANKSTVFFGNVKSFGKVSF